VDWICNECGLSNAGGLFCIKCGAKSNQDSQQAQSAAPDDSSTLPPKNSNLPKVIAAVTITLALAFGVWQNSLSVSAADEVETARTALNDAVTARNSAKQLYLNAESEASLCLVNPWCSYLTYAELLMWSESAQQLLSLATTNENDMGDQLKTSLEELARAENVRNIGIGAGGVASLGTVLWAIVADLKRRKSEEIDSQ
jgi:hypothetical protein